MGRQPIGTETELGRRVVLGAAAAFGTTVALGAGSVALADEAQAATAPTLRVGASGSAVLTLQRRLAALGYWCGRADGTFGGLTLQAVYAVQKTAGLGRDGVVGSRTWSALSRGVRPKPRTTTGTAIEVDLPRQILMVVSGGRLRYTLNTSTGSGERYVSEGVSKIARTPRGTFRIYSRHSAGWQNGPLGKLYRPTYFYGGYAVHGSGSIPPYPASHGCCRVSTGAMDMLWKDGWVPMSRKVLLY